MSNKKQSLISKLRSPYPQWLSWDVTVLLFRVAVSLSLINTHGIPKVTDLSETVASLPDPFGMGGTTTAAIAIFGDLIAPIFVIVGLFTRLALIPMLGITMVGLFIVHAGDPWTVKDVPLMYTLSFLLIFLLGPGKYSFDYRLGNYGNNPT